MKAYSLNEGSYSVDSSKKFIPFDPEKHDKKDRKGSLFIHVHPFVVKTKSDLIVMDTGLGQTTEEGVLLLHRNLKAIGYEPEEVSYVLMSHLHRDHASGMTYEKEGKWHLSFPNATYVIARGEWEMAFSGSSSSYDPERLEVLQRSNQLELVEGSGNVNRQIRYEYSGGHCEYHHVFHIEEDDKHYFFGGDELPEPEQLMRKFAAKYDYDGKKAMQLREEYGKAASGEGWICLFYHSTNAAMGTVEEQNGSFKVKEVKD